MEYPTIILKDKSKRSLARRHPWIFSGGIQRVPENLDDGRTVWVADSGGNVLATGHFGIRSIAVRVLDFSRAEISKEFYRNKLENALLTRRSVGLPNSNTNAYRLIHGEGDGLPGLILDIYADLAVIQTHSRGMSQDSSMIESALREVLSHEISHVVHLSAEKGVSDGEMGGDVPAEIEFKENGLRFFSNWQTGQKTGFFLDQRENRALLGSLAEAKKVLNAFSYTGGFSLYALAANAKEVHSLDSSKPALDLCERHVELNFPNAKNHRSICANALEFFKGEDLSKYDVMVIDPPAFAKHQSARHRAIQAYKRLNSAALKKAKKGSLILTFSCSQVVTPELFRHTIASAAMEAGRNVRVLRNLQQPPDHPVNIFHPEGEYLKGVLLKVE